VHLRRDPRRRRICSVPTRNSRSSRVPARNRHKGAVKRCRSQPQPRPLRNQEGRQSRIRDSSPSKGPPSANSSRQGQTRRMLRKPREHRRSKGRVRVRREAATKMRNEVRVASKARGAPFHVLCSRRLDWRHLAIDTQPPRRFSAHKLNANSTAPIPLSLRPSAWRRADVPLPCHPEKAPASECCGC